MCRKACGCPKHVEQRRKIAFVDGVARREAEAAADARRKADEAAVAATATVVMAADDAAAIVSDDDDEGEGAVATPGAVGMKGV